MAPSMSITTINDFKLNQSVEPKDAFIFHHKQDSRFDKFLLELQKTLILKSYANDSTQIDYLTNKHLIKSEKQ